MRPSPTCTDFTVKNQIFGAICLKGELSDVFLLAAEMGRWSRTERALPSSFFSLLSLVIHTSFMVRIHCEKLNPVCLMCTVNLAPSNCFPEGNKSHL